MKYLMLSILAVLMSLSYGVMAKQDPQDAPGQGAQFEMQIDCGQDEMANAAAEETLNKAINGLIYEICNEEGIMLSENDEETTQLIGATFKDTAEDIASDIALQIAYHHDYTTELPDGSCQVLRVNPGSQTKIMCDTQDGNKSLICVPLTADDKEEIATLCHNFE